MKNQLFTTIALIAGLGLAGSAFARHDDFPGTHAPKANVDKSTVVAPSAGGGRHDERPHGMTKVVPPKQVEAKPATLAPQSAPVATNEPKSAGL